MSAHPAATHPLPPPSSSTPATAPLKNFLNVLANKVLQCNIVDLCIVTNLIAEVSVCRVKICAVVKV